MKLEFRFAESSVLAIREIIARINDLWFNDKRSGISAFIPAGGDLARMLISGETQGEHTEE